MRLRTGRIVLAGMIVAVLGCALYGAAVVSSGFSTRTLPSRLERVLAATARSMAVPARAKTLRNRASTSPNVIEEAKAHWAEHCAQCHANNGSGDTEMGRALYPRPPDMRLRATQQLSDGELYYTINNGVRLTGMPAFGPPSDDDVESWKLVTFIRHLPHMSGDEATQMEALNPKTPSERAEEEEEDRFLNGVPQPKTRTLRRTK